MTTITPAYGRDYKSAKAAKADWEAGKDFRISDLFHPDDGRYVSIHDTSPNETWMIRFDRLTKIAKA
jgi:hypothetical protein